MASRRQTKGPKPGDYVRLRDGRVVRIAWYWHDGKAQCRTTKQVSGGRWVETSEFVEVDPADIAETVQKPITLGEVAGAEFDPVRGD